MDATTQHSHNPIQQLAVLFCLGIGVVWTMLLGIVTVLAALASDKWGHVFHRLWARGVCFLVGIRVELYFAHQLPKTGGYLLASNHESLWDIPVLASLPIDFKWISKSEVRAIPFVGWAMRAIGCFFLTRRQTGQDINVLQEVENGLRAGARILIFPEGTRTRDGALLPLKKGAFRAAQNSGAPLVPVAIFGTYAIAPPGKLPLRRGHRVTVRVGAPMTVPSGADAAPHIERFREDIVRLLKENIRNVV